MRNWRWVQIHVLVDIGGISDWGIGRNTSTEESCGFLNTGWDVPKAPLETSIIPSGNRSNSYKVIDCNLVSDF
jgi:hypothetical protein